MLWIALVALAIVWTAIATVVLGLCASAASGDRALRARGSEPSYTLPRRSTWRPVRTRSFRSCQRDQLAT